MILALAFAVAAAGPPATRIACGTADEDGQSYTIERASSLSFKPTDLASFKRAFRNVKPVTIDGIRFFVASHKVDEDEEANGLTAQLRVGIITDASHAYRLLEKDDWPQTERARESDSPMPRLRRVAAGIFRLDYTETTSGAHAYGTDRSTLLIAIADPPRIAATVDCEFVEMGGACTAFAWLFGSPSYKLSCDWSANDHDFVCAATREWSDLLWSTHRAERRLKILSGDELPVVKEGLTSFASIEDFARRVWRAPAFLDKRVLIQHVGVLERMDASPVSKTAFFAAPGLTDDMQLRLWAISQSGKVVAVTSEKIEDDHEPEARAAEEAEADPDPYTPAPDNWSLSSGGTVGSANLLVLYDGKARGLFWLADDETTDPPAVGLLRLATDSFAFDECDRFMAPANASALVPAKDGLAATIEVHSPRDERGDLLKRADDDDEVPCHVRSTITWSREKGFVQTTTEEIPCKKGELPLAVVVGQNGVLTTRPLTLADDQ